MKKIGFLLLCILILTGCKNTEMTASQEDDTYQREPTVLALEIKAEKTSASGDFQILQIQTDTLEYAVSPRPTDDNLPEVFKAEVLNASNKVVFGSEYKTRFISEQGNELANLKFFCSLPRDASIIKIYYRVAEGVWKQIEAIDL
jgi:hypothetical protein